MDISTHQSIFRSIALRELNGFRVRKRAHMDGITSNFSEIGVMAVGHNSGNTPPLAVSFCKTAKNSHILALADEDGYVNLFNTRHKFSSSSSYQENADKAKICDWVAHHNAVFDVRWIKEDAHVLTASGDQTMKLWDVQGKKCIGVLTGHRGSVKSMCSHPTNADIIVSGSRDGSFHLWDLRCSSTPKSRRGEPSICSTAEVKGAHLSSQAKRVRRGKAASMSITSVLYLKDQVSIATAGAVDSVVKFWDTRNLKSSVTQTCPRLQTSEKERLHGISSLSQDQSGVFLSASCMDNIIYLYNVLQLEKGPVRLFSGCQIESFFVKSAISPDASHIVSGSSDGNAYVWQVNKPQGEPIILKTHDGEVTAVDWCHSEDGKLATSSDDFTVRIWDHKICLSSTKPPASIRRRIMAMPSRECRKLLMKDEEWSSKSGLDNAFHVDKPADEITEDVPITPPKMHKTDGQKNQFLSMSDLTVTSGKTLESASKSPSSVLNPPSSLKRTIRDYFLAASCKLQ
ncbi:hypothetical protein QN277_013735 [Acacia crassicarpa]|uniref:Denticleless protein-like protein n=1 Tax=Acacia crassicarpa TaxID=499986 RepID=A0AAE1TEP7_9FABA|nr:hypothetical protein QN277_013735 [Acacia crassicarpa]